LIVPTLFVVVYGEFRTNELVYDFVRLDLGYCLRVLSLPVVVTTP